jgi:hypothetical protein
MDFNIGDEVVIISAGSIYTREDRIGQVGFIIEMNDKTATISSGQNRIHAALSDLEHTSNSYHLHVD